MPIWNFLKCGTGPFGHVPLLKQGQDFVSWTLPCPQFELWDVVHVWFHNFLKHLWWNAHASPEKCYLIFVYDVWLRSALFCVWCFGWCQCLRVKLLAFGVSETPFLDVPHSLGGGLIKQLDKTISWSHDPPPYFHRAVCNYVCWVTWPTFPYVTWPFTWQLCPSQCCPF